VLPALVLPHGAVRTGHGGGQLKGNPVSRHCSDMNGILCAFLIMAALGAADEPAGRAAIQSVLEALNGGRDQKQIAGLFTADVALVDAANTQCGSIVLVRRVPVLLVMRRETGGWRIASLRLLADWP
jgi:hypothetical protein